METYKHLACEQRYQISAFLKAGFNQIQIALDLGVHKSTVSREVKRNRGLRGYRPKQAGEPVLMSARPSWQRRHALATGKEIG